MQQEIIHTFAVCAYKDSPYLEECLRSVTSQTVKSEVICCTSTPSSYVRELTARYQVPLYVRDGASNIREDWMFAYGKAQGRFVTIAIRTTDTAAIMPKAFKSLEEISGSAAVCERLSHDPHDGERGGNESHSGAI